MRCCIALASAVLGVASFLPISSLRAQAPAVESLSVEQAQATALDAYLYFYPLIVMDLTRRQAINIKAGQAPGRAPSNTFAHEHILSSLELKTALRPNFDRVRSRAWLDLNNGPVVISVPDTRGRDYVMSFLDMWTDVFAVVGKRTTGTRPGHYAITPPGWSGIFPAGITKIASPTSYVWAIADTESLSPIEDKEAVRIQNAYQAVPLANWQESTQSIQIKSDPTINMLTVPVQQIEKMSADAYFTYASKLLQNHPPHLTDQPLMAQIQRLGIIAGQRLAFDKLTTFQQHALRQGAITGQQVLHTQLEPSGPVINGWQTDVHSRGVYGNEYLKRAQIAHSQLGSVRSEDLVTLVLLNDAQGERLNGSKKYVLHFESEALPPAEAGWSIAAYNSQGYSVFNMLGRYALGHRDELQYNPDGSLDIYLQREAPQSDDQSNWLPIAAGELSIMMRIYSPELAVLNGQWSAPAVIPTADALTTAISAETAE